MIDHPERQLDILQPLSALAQTVERIAAGALVYEVPVDVDQRAFAERAHHVRPPDVLE